MEKNFSLWKKQRLNKVDVSKKGSVDADIQHVVHLLNSCDRFFTTSSCSGRIVLIDGASDCREVQKQDCVWLYVSHQPCCFQDLKSSLEKSNGDALMKFEPFVLHVQCRTLQDAQLMHSVAVNSGFRNSGLSVSKTGKIISAVRSTHGLEVPLSHEGKLLVDEDYIHFLVKVANQKMEENLRRIQRFYQRLRSALQSSEVRNAEDTEVRDVEDQDGEDTEVRDVEDQDGEDTEVRDVEDTEVRDVEDQDAEDTEDMHREDKPLK
ncbi:tRNA wybutosine-synthesizing protein 3 homolog isoform X2 [Gouania willdenowi]|uniref:tRNA wybutosine-synthesizing protein 3 homolog isoform X2 n=1 Tax=Gouania willdenowi TaxID=441366 RepID=UPI001054DB2A|nr:tRNA wybutosine-synthesizing protein 3 homolog isoform X2 [Gouania willdenowi]